MKIISASVEQTQGIASGLSKHLKPGDCIALIGNLGCGKTVFVKGLAMGFGCRGKDVLSPTFVLLRQYRGKRSINHFDLYRLRDICQLEQIGYEEYFYSDAVTVIEWADRVKEALPKEHLKIEFKILNGNRRSISLSARGKHYADTLRKFAGQAHKLSEKYKAYPE